MNKKENFYKTISTVIVISSFVWFWNLDYQLNLQILKNSFNISLSLYSGLIFFMGFLTAVIAAVGSRKTSKIREMEYEKKLSSTSIDLSKDRAKVEALERKIATLEKALESKIEENK